MDEHNEASVIGQPLLMEPLGMTVLSNLASSSMAFFMLAPERLAPVKSVVRQRCRA